MIAALLFGINKYNEIYERKRILIAIRDGARKIKNDLSSMCLPLHESFLDAGEFFLEAAHFTKEGMLPQEAVNTAAQKVPCLKKGDIECICRF